VADEMGVDFGLLREVENVNRRRITVAAEKLRKVLLTFRGKRIGLLGMAFKPLTDDVRQSPALSLAALLMAEGAQVVGYDPLAGAGAGASLSGMVVADDAYAAAERAEALVLVTAWPDLCSLDWARLKRVMRRAVVFDGRNALDREKVVAEGFEYMGMGR
jgi:UDPglucose 6-dehydrogenase